MLLTKMWFKSQPQTNFNLSQNEGPSAGIMAKEAIFWAKTNKASLLTTSAALEGYNIKIFKAKHHYGYD